MKVLNVYELIPLIEDIFPGKKVRDSYWYVQKTLYYIKAGMMHSTGNDCIEGDFEKWEFGPVNREAYLKQSEKEKIDPPSEDILRKAGLSSDLIRDLAEFLKEKFPEGGPIRQEHCVHSEGTAWDAAEERNDVLDITIFGEEEFESAFVKYLEERLRQDTLRMQEAAWERLLPSLKAGNGLKATG